MLLRETLRTVVTEVELGKVAVVIAVSQSACQAHVTRGQRELQAAGVGIALLAGGEYQQGTQGVNVKVLVPVQAAFPVHGVGHVLLSFFIGQIVCTILIDTVNMVLACVRVVAAQLIPVRFEVTLGGKVRKARKVKEGGELQALGDETQILVQLYGGYHLRALVVFVAANHLGVWVDVSARLVVTEHDVLDAYMVIVHGIVGGE